VRCGRWILCCAVGAACGPQPRAPAATVASVEPGTCISTTRRQSGSGYADVETTYRPDGQELRRVEETFDADGSWRATLWLEVGFVDDRVASVATEMDASSPLTIERTLETFAYDAEGRLIEEVFTYDDIHYRTDLHRYDGLGQLIETYRVTGSGADQQLSFTWADGRLVRLETSRVGEAEPYYVETRAYLAPAPSLDALVTISSDFLVDERIDRYDGQLLVERHHLEGADDHLAGIREAWAYRDDGQVAWHRHAAGPMLVETLTVYAYDSEGHLVLEQSGPDADRDDVIDRVVDEQAWAWECW